ANAVGLVERRIGRVGVIDGDRGVHAVADVAIVEGRSLERPPCDRRLTDRLTLRTEDNLKRPEIAVVAELVVPGAVASGLGRTGDRVVVVQRVSVTVVLVIRGHRVGELTQLALAD